MTVVVIIPNPLGYCLFVRWPHQRLRACSTILHPSDLQDAVRSLGDRLTVVLVGRRCADAVSEAVLETADLVIVPDAWLKRVPRTALAARAQVAARIASAHRTGQIEQRFRRELQQSFPF